ncbi:unnamed protein product [Nippostrongylus brasiliensis]|uniref:Pecanex-like protein n=1 Tax=Nippostrongylus brasiliensis TaxID=27835 RepID=A0A0N4Y583_NIPBR|nr:unnamed protein product [Nippostrongylus brasiliensis]
MSEAVLKNGGEVLMGEAVSEEAQPQAGDVRAAMPTPPDTPLGDERDSLIVYIRNEASQPSQQYSQVDTPHSQTSIHYPNHIHTAYLRGSDRPRLVYGSVVINMQR